MKKTFITLLLSTSLLFLVSCDSNANKQSTNSLANQTEATDEKDNITEKESKNDDNNQTDKKTASNESENDTVKNDEKVNITIFIPNDTADGLNEKNVTINHLTAYSIINALADNNIVPKGTKAINFEIKNNIGYLDVSSSIYNLQSGSSAETLMLDAIKQTFLKAFNIQKVKLTVDGNTYSGGHINLGKNDYL